MTDSERAACIEYINKRLSSTDDRKLKLVCYFTEGLTEAEGKEVSA